MLRSVTTTYLEMTDPADFRPARSSPAGFHLTRVEAPSPEYSRFLYTAVGSRWWWYMRLPWDYARWLAYLDRDGLETWVAYVSGAPAGYFELEKQEGGNVEIASFGLLPHFIGQRLGGPLLDAAIRRAWDWGATRVWLHTCELDHPRALQNYLSRGFRVYRTEQLTEDLPDVPLQPWPGAGFDLVKNPA
ncbi:MAG: GNAT family N-acetyltransferase [Acidobacteria bacterium]|nr:GNAT family N-acetyltransferase [Acidobacteriota bacterium]